MSNDDEEAPPPRRNGWTTESRRQAFLVGWALISAVVALYTGMQQFQISRLQDEGRALWHRIEQHEENSRATDHENDRNHHRLEVEIRQAVAGVAQGLAETAGEVRERKPRLAAMETGLLELRAEHTALHRAMTQLRQDLAVMMQRLERTGMAPLPRPEGPLPFP